LFAGLATLSFGGCKVKTDTKSADAQRDVAVLEKIVQLPIRPVEVWFRSVPRGSGGGIGPTDWTFLAVMRFEPATLAAFVKDGHLVEKPDPKFPRNEVAPWFPAPVTAALQPVSDTHVRVKGRRYDAAPFARAPAPPGSFFVLDDAPFVILRRPQE
jgi:hypothetical protein